MTIAPEKARFYVVPKGQHVGLELDAANEVAAARDAQKVFADQDREESSFHVFRYFTSEQHEEQPSEVDLARGTIVFPEKEHPYPFTKLLHNGKPLS